MEMSLMKLRETSYRISSHNTEQKSKMKKNNYFEVELSRAHCKAKRLSMYQENRMETETIRIQGHDDFRRIHINW